MKFLVEIIALVCIIGERERANLVVQLARFFYLEGVTWSSLEVSSAFWWSGDCSKNLIVRMRFGERSRRASLQSQSDVLCGT